MRVAGLGAGHGLYSAPNRSVPAPLWQGTRLPDRQLDTPFPFILGLPQCDTERVLEAELVRLGGGVERQVRLEGLTQDGRGVTASLRAGGRAEELRVPYVVGCDGAHSTTRELMGVAFEGVTYPEHFLLADLRLDSALTEDELHVFLSPEGFFQVLPMPGERQVRLFADMPADRPGEPTLALFEALGRERVGMPLSLSGLGWASRFRVHRRLASRYRVGRVLLAGDAAHVHSPVGGQGMNTGLQDAFNLAWKLAALFQGGAEELLLTSYERERRAVGRLILAETDLATRMTTLRGGVLGAARDLLSSQLAQSGPFPRWLAEVTGELSLSLPRGPLATDHREGLLRADLTHDPHSEHASVGEWLAFDAAPGPGARAPTVEFGPAE